MSCTKFALVSDTDEACRLALNLAQNCGWAVFPCGNDKKPTRPKQDGGQGFKDATTDPGRIASLWRNWPGELIGIATGAASGISVLDIDRKHDEARLWWRANLTRLLPTRVYETRSGGLHLYFRHVEGAKCSQNRICPGVDTRGEGGYIIHWFAAGLACHDPSHPAPWPPWLLAELTRATTPTPQPRTDPLNDRALNGIMRRVAQAREGERNGVLYWAACRFRDRGLQAEALIPAALNAGLSEIEVRTTLASAMRGGGA